MRRAGRSVLIVAAGLLLGACGAREAQKPEPPAEPLPQEPPLDASSIPDAVPRREPRSPFGNPVSYEVLGARYYVLAESVGYRERGVASWYGPGFHQGRTSSGEIYDMNRMTAAHKTLPLPCFAQVTNLRNGKSVVVRINDRGPFVANRLIDLSYAAATKLDMLRE
ncbi:MAG: septal ring lytic transglycosylase RlpA family protein, partial [Steroidobacteraceae bacterium]